jgi:hypothetical protein
MQRLDDGSDYAELDRGALQASLTELTQALLAIASSSGLNVDRALAAAVRREVAPCDDISPALSGGAATVSSRGEMEDFTLPTAAERRYFGLEALRDAASRHSVVSR